MLMRQQYQKRIYLSTTKKELDKIVAFRKQHYKSIYPTMNLDTEPLDFFSLNFYSQDSNNDSVTGVARLALETPFGFPQDPYLAEYRKGKRLMEFGRFIVQPSNSALLKNFYAVIYECARELGYNAIIMAMKPKDIPFHKRLMDLQVISQDTGVSYGGAISLSCVSWELDRTTQKFFAWAGVNK